MTFFLEQDAHEVVEQTLIAQELPKDRWSQLREGESRTAVIRGGRRVVALR